VDSIEIKDIQNADVSNDSQKQALSVGKDFGSFKLSVDQGASSATSKITLETAISPNLNLNVDAGGERSSGVGLDWVYRY
jgi:autotransporter translocation and assembly factor TamB